MFETHKSQEFVFPEGLAQEGLQVWETISLSVIEPWLFVDCTLHFNLGESLRSHVFLNNYKQLLLMAIDPHRSIGSIMLASPDYMNQSGSWKFDELAEIWEGVEFECGQTGAVYILKNGARLIDSLHNDEKTLLNLHRVYPPQ